MKKMLSVILSLMMALGICMVSYAGEVVECGEVVIDEDFSGGYEIINDYGYKAKVAFPVDDRGNVNVLLGSGKVLGSYAGIEYYHVHEIPDVEIRLQSGWTNEPVVCNIQGCWHEDATSLSILRVKPGETLANSFAGKFPAGKFLLGDINAMAFPHYTTCEHYTCNYNDVKYDLFINMNLDPNRYSVESPTTDVTGYVVRDFGNGHILSAYYTCDIPLDLKIQKYNVNTEEQKQFVLRQLKSIIATLDTSEVGFH